MWYNADICDWDANLLTVCVLSEEDECAGVEPASTSGFLLWWWWMDFWDLWLLWRHERMYSDARYSTQRDSEEKQPDHTLFFFLVLLYNKWFIKSGFWNVFVALTPCNLECHLKHCWETSVVIVASQASIPFKNQPVVLRAVR